MPSPSSVPRCIGCGAQLPDDASVRSPCPQCGATNRIFDGGISLVAGAELAATGQVVPYSEVLLQTARGLINDRQFGVAVVAAHMACEVVVEQAFHRAFAVRGTGDLEEPLTSFLSGFNLANDRIRRLYTALTNDAVQEQPFWEAFKVSAKLRNDSVHAGKHPAPTQAEQSLRAATEFVAHVTSVTNRLGNTSA